MVTIGICGVGLIGGSLARCFRGKAGVRVLGYTQEVERSCLAEEDIVDEVVTTLAAVAQQADIIFLCTPVNAIVALLDELASHTLKPTAIITDVGSTKAAIVAHAHTCDFGEAVFIGGHPMAGKERAGMLESSATLFAQAYYIITPDAHTPTEAVARLTHVLAHTQAQVFCMDATEHDEIVGAISHMPHLVAALLVNVVAQKNKTDARHAALAAGGFRDLTRIASGDAQLWTDIMLSNKTMLLQVLDTWQLHFLETKKHLEAGDAIAMRHMLEEAVQFRRQVKTANATQQTYECGVVVQADAHAHMWDHLKQLTMLTTLYFVSREAGRTTFRMGFATHAQRNEAMRALREAGYEVFV